GPVRNVVKHPQPPYTIGLMSAIPTLAGDPEETLAQIPGSMPRLGAIPGGCAFNPRCTYSFSHCSETRPEPYPAGSSAAACFLHAEDKAVDAPERILQTARTAGIALPNTVDGEPT
uniref:oligopeptide/dipeptide ABC transporter ATP-binding protein n=1 Tax=uncultured Nitratireductor sp. TaxID=520953 RepID=UPI00345913CF